MNAFWKGLVASVVVYQLVLTYCMLNLANRFAVLLFYTRRFGEAPADVGSLTSDRDILGGTLIALVVVNLVMLYRGTRTA